MVSRECRERLQWVSGALNECWGSLDGARRRITTLLLADWSGCRDLWTANGDVWRGVGHLYHHMHTALNNEEWALHAACRAIGITFSHRSTGVGER